MTAYRETDDAAKFESMDRRISSLESGARKKLFLDFLGEYHIPQFFGLAIGLATICGIGLYMRDCTERQNALDYAHAQEEQTRPSTAALGCQQLCESMGLHGGVLTDYEGTFHPDLITGAGHCGSYSVTRTGHSCICGNGMGGSIRVDPDGNSSHSDDHPGPAHD